MSFSGEKAPNSRAFRDRAEEYRALASSFRSEQMRALLLSVAADYDRMADQAATIDFEDDRAARRCQPNDKRDRHTLLGGPLRRTD